MNWFRHTNSWHWLLMSIALSAMIAAYFSAYIWKKASEKDAPLLLGMRSHADQLVQLVEEDALLVERQVSEIQERINAYEAMARERVGITIPQGEQSVLHLSTEINRALQKHNLRVVEQERVQTQENPQPVAPSPMANQNMPEDVRKIAAQAAASGLQQDMPDIPFTTQEIRYVVEGDYKDMFMFLVRQSHLKPPYHFRGIKVAPAPQAYGMRMEFTVQIHFT